MGLSFGQVVDVLSEANGLSPHRRERFISRLKQWQKMGFPEGVNVGKGVRADYGAKQLFQLAFHMRLLSLGLTPDRAQTILTGAWPRIADAVSSVTTLMARGERELHYLLLRMDALTELREDQDEHLHVYVYPVPGWLIADALDPAEDEDADEDEQKRRDDVRLLVLDTMVNAVTIEVDSIILRIWAAMKKHGIAPELLKPGLIEMTEDFAERMNAPDRRASVAGVRKDSLAGVELCPSCFARQALGMQKDHSHDGHQEA